MARWNGFARAQSVSPHLTRETNDDRCREHLSQPATSYLRYAPTVETAQPDEAEAIAGIIQAMTEQSEVVGREEHVERIARQEHRRSDPNGFRNAAVAYLRDHDAVFELRAQLCSNVNTRPIEDTSVEWPEAETGSHDGDDLIPRQDAGSPGRQRYFDEVMRFRPAHTLAGHRPLGSVMRARLKVYAALSSFRHGRNAAVTEEPADPSRIPA